MGRRRCWGKRAASVLGQKGLCRGEGSGRRSGAVESCRCNTNLELLTSGGQGRAPTGNLDQLPDPRQANLWATTNKCWACFCESLQQRDGTMAACRIVNHSPSFSPSGGSHWMACRVKGTTSFWFNSYGLSPHAQLELTNSWVGVRFSDTLWLKRMGVESVEYNDHDLQSVASEVCGLYACYFAVRGLPKLNPTPWNFLSDPRRQPQRRHHHEESHCLRLKKPNREPRLCGVFSFPNIIMFPESRLILSECLIKPNNNNNLLHSFAKQKDLSAAPNRSVTPSARAAEPPVGPSGLSDSA